MKRERLLNVARALRESPKPNKFTMDMYARDCNTPACAWGHYCFRQDLQSEFQLSPATGLPIDIFTKNPVTLMDSRMDEHFGLTSDQVIELFSVGGCGGAKTAIDAAEYIEEFVRRHS